MVFQGDGPELGGFDFKGFLTRAVSNVNKVTSALVDKPEVPAGGVVAVAKPPISPLVIGGVALAGGLGLILILKKRR